MKECLLLNWKFAEESFIVVVLVFSRCLAESTFSSNASNSPL